MHNDDALMVMVIKTTYLHVAYNAYKVHTTHTVILHVDFILRPFSMGTFHIDEL